MRSVPKCGQGLLESEQRGVEADLVVPELAGDEDVLGVQPGPGDGAPHFLLVPVGLRGVDVAIAHRQRRPHRLDRLLGFHQQDAQAELRDPHPVVQSDVRHLSHHVASFAPR